MTAPTRPDSARPASPGPTSGFAHDGQIWLARIVVSILVALVLVGLFPDHMAHWDEYQLAYGVEDLDLRRHQPHPPGYYLFIVLGRILRPLTGDASTALRWVSVLATIGFVNVAIAPTIRQRAAAWGWSVAALAFALSSPVLFRYSTAGLTYAAEGATWCALLVAIARRPGGRWCSLLFAGMGFAGGLRQTLLVWGLVAVVVAALTQRSWLRPRDIPRLAGAFVVGIAAWLVPLLVEAGGWDAYREATASVAVGNIWAKSIFVAYDDPVFWQRRGLMGTALVSGLGSMILPVVIALVVRVRNRDRATVRRNDLLGIGALISFGFYFLLTYDSPGYLVATTMASAAWTLRTLAEASSDLTALRSGLAAWATAGVVALTPVVASPTEGLDYGEAYRNDAIFDARFEAVRSSFDPATTVLVTSAEYWHFSFRHVAYALPKYATVQLVSDPYFAIVTPDTPYLVSRNHHIDAFGPDGVDLQQALGPGQTLRQVVYMIPYDVPQFVHTSCAPVVRALRVTQDEILPVIAVSDRLRVRIVGQRIVCSGPDITVPRSATEDVGRPRPPR